MFARVSKTILVLNHKCFIRPIQIISKTLVTMRYRQRCSQLVLSSLPQLLTLRQL